MLGYGYSLWHDVIFVDNINVLDLSLRAEKLLKLNVFLGNLKKMHTLWSIDSQGKISKIGATRYQILRLKCTKFDFCWGSAPDPAREAYSTPPDPLTVFKAYF